MNRTRTTRWLAAITAAGMLIAACGDDDEESSSADRRTRRIGRSGRDRRRATDTTAAADTGGGGESIRLWLNGGDTPDPLVEYAIAEFNKIHPDVEVQFERQEWTGIVEKLTTALSGSDSPDVVEFGNTQAQTFEAAGAVVDLTDKREDARRRRPPAEPARGRHVRRQALRRAVLRRRPHRAVPQGPVRGGRDRGPDHARRVPRRRRGAQGGQRRRPELLRDLPARPQLVRRAVVHLGERWRHRHQGRRRVGRRARLRRLDRRARVLQGAVRHGELGTGRRRRRQRLHRVLQRRGRHDAGAGLEAGPDHQPRRRLPRHGSQHRRTSPSPAPRPARRHPSSSADRTWRSR